MDIGDLNDPNLDGDFLALVERRQIKLVANDTEDVILQTNNEIQSLNNKISQIASEVRPVSAQREHVNKIRKNLFDAIDANDVAKFNRFVNSLKDLNITLSSNHLRLEEDKSTVLNYSIRKNCWKIVDYILDLDNKEIILQDFIITVQKVKSEKSNLHILSESGNYEYADKLIKKLSDSDIILKYIERVVLVEPEGQRPRHLNCLHIASLYGHTKLVDLFINNGIKVNVLNNKKDTPVLWAARGNHIDTVRRLISLGADLQLENDKGSTALYWAIRYGLIELTEILIIEGKANIHQRRKLGLVSPIILASALGYAQIVNILLENGANPNEKFSQGQTSLHVASAEGNNDVIEILLKRSDIDVNTADLIGNTALLYAAKSGNIKTMKILAQSGADFDIKNKQDVGIWDYMFKNSDLKFWQATCNLYKMYKKSPINENNNNKNAMQFPVGKTPLHIAAANGDLKLLKFLIENGADPQIRDLNGNTYFHVAAKENKTNILDDITQSKILEDSNSIGDTAMHIACKSGNIEACQSLLQKSKLDARNKMLRIPFHEAVDSPMCTPELIKLLIGYTIKANTWSLVDAKDKNGNTALHIAAHKGRIDILNELINLNPNIVNNDGDTPLHVASKQGEANILETLISLFKKDDNGLNLDTVNKMGESCLHICGRKGDAANVVVLIDSGADLSLLNKDANSVIHVIIEESIIEPQKMDSLIDTYKGIVNNSTKWWCMKNSISFPHEESELYLIIMRKSMIYLLSNLYNKQGLNAINFSISLTAIDFLEELLNTSNVYRFKEEREYIYDVSNILPKNKVFYKKIKAKNSVSAINDFDQVVSSEIEAVDIIISLEDDILASRILDITPIKQIMQNYWKKYEWIYFILMLLHILYMILLMVFTNPISTEIIVRFNQTAISCKNNSDNVYIVFIIWPGLICLCEIIFFLIEIFKFCKNYCIFSERKKVSKDIKFSIFNIPSLFIYLLVNNLAHICSILFCSTVIISFMEYKCPTSLNRFLISMSLAFIFGWSYTMNFTKAFATLHGFTIMLKYIILKDLTRFIAIYIIVLLACGMAFNVLFQINPEIANRYGHSLSATIFNTFNMMLGLGSLLDENFDASYASYGGDPIYIKIIYTSYIIIASVILLSLLVAMMTDTYTGIKAREGTTWKIGSLRLALKLEKALPFINYLYECICSRNDVQFDKEKERWTLSVSYQEVTLNKFSKVDNDAVYKIIQRMENKLDNVNNAYTSLESKFHAFIFFQGMTESNKLSIIKDRPISSKKSR